MFSKKRFMDDSFLNWLKSSKISGCNCIEISTFCFLNLFSQVAKATNNNNKKSDRARYKKVSYIFKINHYKTQTNQKHNNANKYQLSIIL